MTPLSNDGAAPSRITSKARDLARAGPEQAATAGPGRRHFRRLVLRLMRPYTAYQQSMNDRLLDAVDRLDARTESSPQLEEMIEELLESIDALRARIDAGSDVIAGSRALPYMAAGVVEEFRDPVAGVVLGYRDAGSTGGGYAAFEDVFRGPEERVRERQRVYLDLVREHEPVLDVGCGRGEFLDLLREAGIAYGGVDSDPGMVERCRAKGHGQVALAEADTHLESLAEDSLGAIFSAQVIEHLSPPEVSGLLSLAHSRLRPGGILIAETVNPHAPHAFKTFWVDPMHRHPVFPEVALVLCRLAGFASAYVFHPLGTGHVEDDRYRESEYTVVATKR
jgi:SAM-dependent methyltransferase